MQGGVDTFGNAPREWDKWLVIPDSLPLPLGTPDSVVTNAVDSDGGGRWRGGMAHPRAQSS